jgi:hypothetical protein
VSLRTRRARLDSGPFPRRQLTLLGVLALALGLGLGSALAGPAGAAPVAPAGVSAGVTPTLPSTVTLGQTGIPASLQIVNASTAPESTGTLTVNTIEMVLACGTASALPGTGDCPSASADPGVLTASSTAAGESGTACAGITFTIATVDAATGQVGLTPSMPVVLSSPGTANAVCRIDFAINAVSAPPNPESNPTPNSYQTVALAHVIATSSVTGGTTGDENGTQPVVIQQATPTLTSAATPSAPLGQPISDTATLHAATPPGPAPTGSMTFTLFNNASCTGAAVFTSTVAVAGAGNYTSPNFTATSSGSYVWVVAYSGDASNAPVLSPCGDAGESSVVTKAVATLTTTASGSVPAGGAISDTASLSGAFNPTGTITFTAFGPNDSTCSGTPLGTSTVAVTGNGTYTSGGFTTKGSGTYQFVATYSGDANNTATSSACGSPGESVTVSKASPGIVTSASPGSAQLGATISDTATLSGGFSPTGTVTFTVFGPNNATCSGAPAGSSTVPVSGNGSYTSGPFTPTSAGTYRFVATYSGDVNDAAAVSPCGSAGESVTVTKASLLIVTSASPSSAQLGATISDTATLSGGASPTGTVTFTLFGPSDATCSGAPVFTSTVPVTGNGAYQSGPFAPTSAGTYRFVATYSGDANNTSASSACNSAGEQVVVSPAGPTIVTQATAGPGSAVHDTAVIAGGASPTGTLTFRAYGPSDPTCASTPAFTSTVTVSGNGSYSSGSFTVPAPGSYLFVASYSGDANNAPASGACGSANEGVTFAAPALAVTKSASPPSLPAPGGAFTFTVQVTNPSPTDPITITSLVDNIYGNVATLAGSTCGSLIGVTLAPGASSPPCSFTGSFTGSAGASQTDTVAAGGTDSTGFTATATASATVTLTAAPGPPTVTTGAASGVTTTTASLAGSVTPNGPDAKAVFEFGPSTSFGSITSIADVGAGFSPVSITGSLAGLSPRTTYFYRLVSTNSFGTTSGTVKSFTTTGPATAPVVVTLAPVSAGNTSAVLAGTVNPAGQATAFTIEYGTTTSFGSITPVVALDSASSPEPVSATASGLTPDTTYLYRVVATNASGTTAGAVMSVTTGPGSIPVVTTGAASSITSTAATLTGTVDPKSSPTSFVFEYGTTTAFGSLSAVDSAGSMAGVQSVQLPIGGLLPSTTYVYRIDATNANGTVTGAVRSFTTAGG